MRYISLQDIEVGMTIAHDIKDIYGRILLIKGATLTFQKLEKLKSFKVSGLYIEDEWSSDIEIEPVISEQLTEDSIEALQNIDMEKLNDCASSIVDTMLASEECMNDIEVLKAYDENTFEHSINVAVYAVTMGIGLGYKYDRLKNLVLGSLLHDIGKRNVPLEIITKSGKLTDNEYKEIQKHSTYGYNMIKYDILMSASVKQIVYQHHENYDGSGYPRGLQKDNIFELSMVVHICDVFDALISKRSYKEAFSFKDTISILKDGRDKMFKSELLDSFFETVPIYHKGIEVTLSDNSKALVFKNNKGNMLKPTVKLRNGTYIDLRKSYLEIIS